MYKYITDDLRLYIGGIFHLLFYATLVSLYQYFDDSKDSIRKKWYNFMTTEDFHALIPLIYSHINPYGTFNLNMEERILIGGDETLVQRNSRQEKNQGASKVFTSELEVEPPNSPKKLPYTLQS